MDLQLRDLKYFEAVATAGSMAMAGKLLGRTQPALTRSIERLEQVFDSPLFEPSGPGIRLTPVGDAVLARARQYRVSAHDAAPESSDFSVAHSGHVRIGCGPIAAHEMMPQLCGLLLAQMKRVTVQITVGASLDLCEQLRAGELDLVLGLLPEAGDELVCHPLIDDVVVVAASANHPLFELRKLTMASLLAYPWVLPGPSNPGRVWLDAAFERRGLPRPTVQVEANSIPMLPRLIARTQMLSFVSRHSMGRGRRRSVKEVPLAETTLSRQLGVSHRRAGNLSPVSERLLSLLQTNAAALLEQLR